MPRQKETGRHHNSFFKKNKCLLLFISIYIIVSVLLFDPKLFCGGDNAIYIILTESIVSGQGYKDMYLPEEPPHSQYPFGFPLLLSLPLLIFGKNLIVLKSLVLLTGLVSFIFVYLIAKSLFKDKANITMLFYLSLPIPYLYNVRILTEIPFMCFSLGALYFFIRVRKNSEFFYYVSFIFATYAFFIRTAGVSLIIAMMLFLILKKQYKYFVIFLFIFLVFFLPWQIRNAHIPREVNYLAQLLAKDPYQIAVGRANFFDLLMRVLENCTFYSFTILPKMLASIILSRLLAGILGVIFIVLISIGFLKKIRRFSAIELYFILSIMVMLVWPRIWSSERFVLPVLPFFVFYVFGGLLWIAGKIRFEYFVKIVIGILIFTNFVAIILYSRGTIRANMSFLKGDRYAGYHDDWRNYFMIIDWVGENSPSDKIIMARKPEFVYLLSRRKSLTYPITSDHSRVKKAIRRCDYIIIDNFYGAPSAKLWLLPVLEKERENYHLVYKTTTPEFYLLKVLR